MTDDPQDSLTEDLDRFVVEAMERGCVWGLEGSEGWALCDSERHSETQVIPFWSDEAQARAQCHDEWSDYQALPIDLEEFLDEWLPGMHEDVFLVGVNWNDELEGEELEPLDLLEEFQDEMAP